MSDEFLRIEPEKLAHGLRSGRRRRGLANRLARRGRASGKKEGKG